MDNSARPKKKITNHDSIDTECDIQRDFEAKADKIADIIIDAFIYKKPKAFDLDDQTDLITYEDSENRLICIGLVTAIVFAITSLTLIVKNFEAYNFATSRMKYASNSSDIINLNFPSPHVVFMDPIGKGLLLSFQLNQSNHQFEFDWQFKVPTIPKDTGYFLFQDQSKIFVIPSVLKSKMTMIHSSTLKHTKLWNSQIPEEFYNFGNSVRIGDFIIVFGGIYLSSLGIGFTVIERDQHCSSIQNSCKAIVGFGSWYCPEENEGKPSTAIWSISKQVWIKGPFLPIKNSCVFHPSGFSLNRTHGVLLAIPDSNHIVTQCLEAYTFSMQNFRWVDVDSCLVTLDINGFEYGLTNLVALTTATIFEDKQSNHPSVLIHCHFLNYNFHGKPISIYKFYMIKWHTTPKVTREISFDGGSGPLFTLQNTVYMADFQTDHQIKIFAFGEESFNWKQTFQLMNGTEFSPQDFRMTAVPYYG